MDEFEVLMEVHEITERKDGSVYRTKFIEKRWVPMGVRGDGKDLMYIPLSTGDPEADTPPRRVRG